MHWLQAFFGFRAGDQNGTHYLFFSGPGTIIIPPLITLAGLGFMFWWHHRCHVHRCLRYARRTTAAGDRACRRHHPEGKITAQRVAQAHHDARRSSE